MSSEITTSSYSIKNNLLKLKHTLVYLETPDALKNISPGLRKEYIRQTTVKFKMLLGLKQELSS
jgi:hypothetical protein